MKGDRERCLDAGMDGYISKPVRSAELLRVLNAIARGTDLTWRPDATIDAAAAGEPAGTA
jgi:two-component system, sensor histidine kinase and response regulator